MSERYTFRHEVDFQEYDAVVESSRFSIASPGLGGTDACMACEITSTTEVYYSRAISWTNFEPEFLIRVHIDPNSLTMPTGAGFSYIRVMQSTNRFVYLMLGWNGSSYTLSGGVNNDAFSSTDFSAVTITDAEHVVEVRIIRADTASSNDGQAIFRVDGTTRQTVTGLDIYNIFNGMSQIRVGGTNSIDSGTSGTFYIDEVSLRDDEYWPGSYDRPAGTTYYVSAAGNNSNAGTSEGAPWLDLGKVEQMMAAGSFKAGDRVLLRRGDTFSASSSSSPARRLDFRLINGCRIDLPFYVGAYGTGADPKINGASHTSDAPIRTQYRQDFVVIEDIDLYDPPFGIRTEGGRGWIIQGCKVRNCTSSYGMHFNLADWLQVRDTEVMDTIGEGIYLGYPSSSDGMDTSALIINCLIHDTRYDGIDIKYQTRGCIVRGNTIYNAPNYDGTGDIQLSDAAITCRGFRHNIRENDIYDTGNASNSGVWQQAGISTYETAVGCRIEFNKIKNVIAHSSVVSFGVRLSGDGGHRVINNSIYDADDNGMLSNPDSGSAVSTIRNNIVHTATDGFDIATSSTLPSSDYNCYYTTTNNTRVFGTTRTIAAACSNHSIECNSITSNPAFLDLTDLEIDGASPCYELADDGEINIQLFDNQLSLGWHQPGETLPYRVLKDGFETNDFRFWTSSVTNGGNLATTTTAAMTGNYGMRATINNTNAEYVARTFNITVYNCHTRVYINPANLTMSIGDELEICQLRGSGANRARVYLGYNGAYYLRFTATIDGGTVVHSSSRYAITAAQHYFEIAYHASVSATYNRGLSFLKIDGEYVEGFFDLNNDASLIDEVRLGITSTAPATVSGYLDFDEVIIDDVGDDINDSATGQSSGSPPAATIQPFIANYRRRRVLA